MASILIVDDHPTNRAFLVTLLGYAGHQLLEADDGARALEAVRAARPDLVIADVLMPTMDGYEFVRRVRADPAIAPTPVVFYTAIYLEQEARALARDCGVEHILVKPASPELILRTVTAVLGCGPLAPAPARPAPVPDAFDRAHTRLLTDTLAAKVDELTAANSRLAALLDESQRHAAALDQEIAERKLVEAQRDRLLAQEKLARAAAERAAERIARLQTVTAACSEALTLDQVAEVVIDQGIALPGATAGLIALLTDDRAGIQIVRAHGYAPDAVAKWQMVPLDAAVPLTEAVQTGEAIWLESAAAIEGRYPQLADHRAALGGGALIAIPLIAHGQALGSFGLSFAGERAFGADERAFILALARQFAQAIDRARLHQETQAAARRAEEALALLESVVQTAPVGFAFIDEQLRYRMINDNLAKMNGASIEAHVGHTVGEVLPELGPTLEPLLRHVLASGEPLLNIEVSGLTAATKGLPGHWLISYYLVRTRGGHALGLGTIVNDISARKRAEDRQATQLAVTRITAEAENRYDAIPALLETICRGSAWDVGEFWRVNPERNLLCWENDWRAPAFDGGAFLTTGHTTTFARGAGLPGRVWASGRPEWSDPIVAASSPRAAQALEAGLRSAFAFPILGAGMVLGVMVFLSRQARHADPDLLVTMADIGSQIGQFFERAQAEERLWQYTQRLKTLHMIDQAILAAHSPEEIAQAALRYMRELAPCRATTVSTFDFVAHEAIVLAVESSVPTPLQRGAHMSLERFLSLPTLQQGQPFIMEDLQALPNPSSPHQLALKDGIRSYLSVPIGSQHTLIGALTLFSDRPRAFVPEVIDIAHEVGSQLAVALQNAQLFEQVRVGREHLRHLSRQLVRAQEDERRHIARELHDEVGQSLTAALLNLQVVGSLTDLDELPTRLDDSINLIDRVLRQVRTLSLDLRPALLDDLGLAPALNWLLERQAERAGFVAQFSADSADARLPSDLETTCFRVVQEALTNIVRYARARNVSVDLARGPAELHLVVRDDGVGFDVVSVRARAARGESSGLLGMQERVGLLGGQIQVESSPGHGSAIYVSLPLSPPVAEEPAPVGSGLP